MEIADSLGLENDCGGPCIPFSYQDDFGCVVSVTYTEELSYDGNIYDMPHFVTNCGGPSSQQYGPQPGQGVGGGGSNQPPKNGTVSKVCSAIPTGRTIGVSGGLGAIGSVGGGGELVVNYNSGQVSAFAFGGVQIGWNGGASASAYAGFVFGLNNSNSNYSGGFTGVNGGLGVGGFAASSSGGLTGGARGLAPNGAVNAAGVSISAGLLGGFSGGVTATNYTNPLQLGKFWAFSPLDAMLYGARQVFCK